MKIWNNELLRGPEDDPIFGGGGSGGGEGADAGGGIATDDGEGGNEGGEGSDEGGGAEGGAAPASQAIDYDRLGETLARSMQNVLPKPPTQQPQMSDEEYDRRTSRMRVDEKLVQRILNPDATDADRAKALQEMIDGTATHAVVVAQMLHQQQLERMREEFAPLMAQRRETMFKSFETDLTTKYPSLKGQSKLLSTVVENLRTRGWQPKSDSDAVQTVASTMEALIKSVNPQFSLTAGRAGGSGMASMTSGHGSGANTGGGGGKKKSWQGVF